MRLHNNILNINAIILRKTTTTTTTTTTNTNTTTNHHHHYYYYHHRHHHHHHHYYYYKNDQIPEINTRRGGRVSTPLSQGAGPSVSKMFGTSTSTPIRIHLERPNLVW